MPDMDDGYYAATAKLQRRITELEAALVDCIPFVAVHADRWARDNESKDLHETHRKLLDRIGGLTGRGEISAKLKR